MNKHRALERLRRFKNSQFLKSSLVLFYGNTLAQVIFLCALPFLTRLYTPAMFGGFGFVLVITTLVGGVATLRYEEALVIAEPSEEKTLLQICFFSALIVATLSGAIAYFSYALITASQQLSFSVSMLVIAIFCGILFTALSNSLQNYFVKKGYFKSISVAQLLRSVLTVGLQFILVSYGAVGLIAGNIAGLFIAFSVVAFFTLKESAEDKAVFNPKSLLVTDVSVSQIRSLSKRYKDFPQFDMPHTLLNSVSQGSPVFLLMTFSGAAAVGAYTLIIRVLQKPVDLITKPIRLVFFKKSSDLAKTNRKRLLPLFRILTATLGLLSLIPTLIIFLKGPELFAWVFGADWVLAGEYSRWVVIWVGVRIMNVPTTTMVKVLRKQDKMLKYGACLSIASIIALSIGTFYFSALVGIAAFSVTGAIGTLLIILWMDRLLLKQQSV